MNVGGPNDLSIQAVGTATPPPPPPRERDSLEGLLAVTLSPTVTPHRERLVDILKVIDRTQTGRELLYDFRTLAKHGQYPCVELADPKEAPQQEAAKPHALFLNLDTLTAGASEIGLSPEAEHASSVVSRLTEIRNALALQGQEGRLNTSRLEALDVPMDPGVTVAAFRKELEASGALGAIPVHRPSMASHPYGAVTESVDAANDAANDTRRPGTARRAFRWADRKVQAFRDFVLRRRDPSATDSPRKPPGSSASANSSVPGSPVSGNPSAPGVTDVAAQAASIPDDDATPDAKTPDRPLIKEAKDPKTSRHRRTFSIRHLKDVRNPPQDADTNRSRADTVHIRRKETS